MIILNGMKMISDLNLFRGAKTHKAVALIIQLFPGTVDGYEANHSVKGQDNTTNQRFDLR